MEKNVGYILLSHSYSRSEIINWFTIVLGQNLECLLTQNRRTPVNTLLFELTCVPDFDLLSISWPSGAINNCGCDNSSNSDATKQHILPLCPQTNIKQSEVR